MKKLLIKLFPILDEEVPAEWLNESHVVYRIGTSCIYIGCALGCVFTLLLVEIIDKLILKK